MRRNLTVFAMLVALSGIAFAQDFLDQENIRPKSQGSRTDTEPDLSNPDPLNQFWENIAQHPFRGVFDPDTTWGKMMDSLSIGAYMRFRYDVTNIEFVQRVQGPTPTGPTTNLAMPGDKWRDWLFVNFLVDAGAKLTDDISVYASVMNMNVIGENVLFDRTMPPAAVPAGKTVAQTQLSHPMIYDPEVFLYEGYVRWDNFILRDMTAKVGRQELVYGDEWLLSNNWFYGGTSFDTALLSFNQGPNYHVDFFAAELAPQYAPLDSHPQIFGMYSTYAVDTGFGESKPTLLDFFILYSKSDLSQADLGVVADFVNDKRYTVGARLAGYFLPDVDYNLEAAYQFGHTANAVTKYADVSAFGMRGEIGKDFTEVLWSPRVALRAGYASGDSDNDRDAGAFNPLYGQMHGYYGLADLFHFTNLTYYALAASMFPDEAHWTLGAQGYVFKLSDPPAGVSNNLGKELDLYASYRVTKNFRTTAVYALVAEGNAFRNMAGGTNRLQRFYINLEYAF